MRIGIVGAGIGGLCAAIGLQRAGAQVTVFEQAPVLRAGGSGLSVFANGLRALDVIGVGDAFRQATSAEVRELRGGQRRPDGAWLARIPTEAVAELRVIDRAVLHDLLLDHLAPGTVRSGYRIVRADPDGSVVVDPGREPEADGAPAPGQDAEAGPSGTSDESFDLVVAADGLRSTVRRSWPGDPGIRYAGYSAWRGITDRPVDLYGEAGETWGIRQRFGLAPLSDGRVYWFAVATMAQDVRIEDEMAAVRATFGHWHAPIPALLEATPADRVHRLPINELAGPLPSYVRGRTVLLGDAAHAMTPNLGQGGGQAMEDAAVLTVALGGLARDDAPDPVQVGSALARYDALRRPRSQRIARMSRLVGQMGHVRGAAVSRVRDQVLRLTPERALVRQIRQVQGWEPPAG
ncbi:FAD-dependent monooxygenase [Brevibacterium sp. R8603A2]|uniref:FAD-dependent monooxygenase n=1 Tax=Brevibacterium sp. R8603A2 TaxID=2929779 RepID=UPI001FF8FDC3|nr:FAD-dependent monooxygenase [Brevibacterium sp. R8603A2]MCK1802272.1 FAD-dependent monooxygenase [Brevibacterium sp. R8603A2]